jgi:hypothetical protein
MDAPQADFNDGYDLFDFDPWCDEKRIFARPSLAARNFPGRRNRYQAVRNTPGVTMLSACGVSRPRVRHFRR